jgi:hypothetical protein
MRLLLSSHIFDLFNLLVRAADDYLLVPTRLLIEPMIGHRIGSIVSDRGQKLVVAASRKVVDVRAALLTALKTNTSLPRPPQSLSAPPPRRWCRCRARLKSYAGTPERQSHQRDDGSSAFAWADHPSAGTTSV